MSCHGHSHDHDHVDETDVSLRKYIDIPNVRCLNEDEAGMAQRILKPYESRLEMTTSNASLKSQLDGDVDLLLHIPFTEAVTIHYISIAGPRRIESETAGPKKVKIFVDREDLDFDEAMELPPTCEIELVPSEHELEYSDEYGTIDYPLRPGGRFQNISNLALYFPDPNYAEDDDTQTEISFIGFKGKGTSLRRRAVDAVYEKIGMPDDNEVSPDELTCRRIL